MLRQRIVPLSVCLLAGLVLSLPESSLRADDGPASPADSGSAEATNAGEGASAGKSTTGDAAVAVPEIEPIEEEPRLVDQIDRTFAGAVDAIAQVLFYRLGSSHREYVIVEHKEYYVRPQGGDGPFRKPGPSEPGVPDSLNADELTMLTAQGRIITGSDGEPYRPGKLDGETVEYVTLKFDEEIAGRSLPYGSKYVHVESEGHWQRYLKRRGIPDPDAQPLTDAQIEELASRGWLEGATAGAGSGSRDYIESEEIGGAPVVVLWLVCGAVFFTLYMRFVNVWGFRHAVNVVRGKYDNPDETGEVTHFQALSSALSATVGLGNIAGVTIAMTLGGPGAFFWMTICGLFGMTSKFTECTLGQKYRTVKPDGTVLGGPMRYLYVGLQEMKLGPLGFVLSVLFAIMCIFASFGGGNMFQANQSGTTLVSTIQEPDLQERRELNEKIAAAAEEGDIERLNALQDERDALDREIEAFEKNFRIGYGLVLAFFVAIVIIGGIRRIGAAAEKIVPTMCAAYIAACAWIILNHLGQVPDLVVQIVTDAFSGRAMGGGLVGVLVIGVQRGAFSNEAGIGSAAIAHSAARTEEPIREGAVALLEPFIDTIVVCSMTALVILITGAWSNNTWIEVDQLEGAQLTARAFGEEITWFPWVLSVAVVFFAYSTIITWCYYGERSWERLFGPRSTILYKILAVTAVFIGAIVNLGAVLSFSDMMILSMAFPNILGVVLLAPRVRRDLLDYWRRYRADEFRTFK